MRAVRISQIDEDAGSHREQSAVEVARDDRDVDDPWEELPEMSPLELALAG